MGGASSSYSTDILEFGNEHVKPLLILDLNDLLVRRTPQKQTRNSVKVGRSWMQTRNDLKPFLQTIFDRYTVAVWSAALPFNVAAMCAHVFGSYRSQLLFEWSQAECIVDEKPHPNDPTRLLFRKDLARVWSKFGQQFGSHNTLIVDDCVHKMVRNSPSNYLVFSKDWERSSLCPELVGEIADRLGA
jgi:hypothetical protein